MNIKTKQHYFVGLDVHLRFTAVCILDANCKIVKEQIVKGHSPEVCKFLREKINGSFDVVFEACDGYGFWHEKLSRIARRVVVAHPNHLRAIWNTKKKTDRIDAQKLAKLLGLNLIPPVYVPKIDVRDWRMLIQHRKTLVQKRTRIKNKLRAILRRNHIPAPRNLWSKKNLHWLRDVELDARGETLQRDMLLEDLAHYDNQIARVEVELDQRAKNNPGVIVLKTIPGVANRTAEAVVAWIDDVSRFSRSKQIGAYFGFAVSEDSSGGKRRLGHISRQGPGVVRQLLVEAVHRMNRFNPTVRSWVERFKCGQEKRKQIAVVAAAHKLSRCMFAMLQTGEVWNPAA
ncbi:MAG: IS110 family transposase [Candidatus Sabulitectum sp.]|nr:IS110 family transposase [Candidatus Sabulitectum sp.]